MGILHHIALASFCCYSVLLHAQRDTPGVSPPFVPKPVPPLPPDPGRLYWPGGLPPYDGPIPPEDPPLRDPSSATIVQDSIRWVVDVAPSFPGGEESLRAYLQENLIYPLLALEAGVEGVIRIDLVVMKDGRSKDILVAKGERNAELHAEAVRLVRMIPLWVPAQLNGLPVAAYTSVKIPFRIKD